MKIDISYNFIITAERIIKIIIYIIIMFSTWLAVNPLLKPLINKSRKFQINYKKSELDEHIERVLSVTMNTKTAYSVLTFKLFSIFIFLATFIFTFSFSRDMKCIFLSTIVGFLPYIILRIKLHTIRVESSYQGEILISELANQYKIYNLNMIEAIDQTAQKLNKEVHVRNALIRLALNLKQYKGQAELDKFINEFIFSIDTQWSIMLGNNIFLSIKYHDDVREALDDILDDLKVLNQAMENNKQINNESYFMIKYCTPFTYILSIVATFKYFNFTLTKFIENQFKDPMGFKYFIYSISLIVINYIIYLIVRKPKNDF